MKKIAFHTLGCKVNQVETEQMIEQFTRRGYQVVDFGDPADVYIINTCTVTHISDRKSRAMLRRAVRRNPNAMVVATGCVAQVDAVQLAQIEGIGLIIGNQNKDYIADIVNNALQTRKINQKILLEPIYPAKGLSPVIYNQPHSRTRAFVKIQDGCQSFCSYCIVPFARGPVRSKAPEDVTAEIRQLIGLGYKEIVLTGIHTGLYGMDIPGWDILSLLEKILTDISGDFRIRLSSIEPLELNQRLLNLMANDRRFCRHFHIPLQSGSDRILASMRRRYNRKYYKELILQTAALIPDAAFTADVMAGYPTETAADFHETCDLLNDLPIYDLHVFKYSRRSGTTAADLIPQIEAHEKQQRSEILLDLARHKKSHFLQSFLGRELIILAERNLCGDIYSGLSDNYIEVRFNSPDNLTGEFVPLIITETGPEWASGFINPGY